MRPPRPIPAHLTVRAFTRAEAIAAGITPRMLQHPRFEEVHPSVYRLTGLVLDERGRIDAARRALPDDARISHGTRIRMLGVDRDDLEPIHFTVARDHHLDIPGIALRRTVLMPPNDGVAVSIEAAFIGYAASARLIDRVVVADWLIHRGHTSIGALLTFAHDQPWRPGAAEVVAVVPLLDGRSRSIPESETRVCLEVAGLPRPAVNLDVHTRDGRFLGCGDLVYLIWKLLIEYEGGQHFTDARQIASDVDRYARLRADGWEYVQVTKQHLGQPKNLVRRPSDPGLARLRGPGAGVRECLGRALPAAETARSALRSGFATVSRSSSVREVSSQPHSVQMRLRNHLLGRSRLRIHLLPRGLRDWSHADPRGDTHRSGRRCQRPSR